MDTPTDFPGTSGRPDFSNASRQQSSHGLDFPGAFPASNQQKLENPPGVAEKTTLTSPANTEQLANFMRHVKNRLPAMESIKHAFKRFSDASWRVFPGPLLSSFPGPSPAEGERVQQGPRNVGSVAEEERTTTPKGPSAKNIAPFNPSNASTVLDDLAPRYGTHTEAQYRPSADPEYSPRGAIMEKSEHGLPMKGGEADARIKALRREGAVIVPAFPREEESAVHRAAEQQKDAGSMRRGPATDEARLPYSEGPRVPTHEHTSTRILRDEQHSHSVRNGPGLSVGSLAAPIPFLAPVSGAQPRMELGSENDSLSGSGGAQAGTSKQPGSSPQGHPPRGDLPHKPSEEKSQQQGKVHSGGPQINLKPRTHPLGKSGSKWKGVPLSEDYMNAMDEDVDYLMDMEASQKEA